MKCKSCKSACMSIIRFWIALLGLLWFLWGQFGLWIDHPATPALPAVITAKKTVKTPAPVVEEVVEEAEEVLPPWFVFLRDNELITSRTLEEYKTSQILTRATATPLLTEYANYAEIDLDEEREGCDFPDISEVTTALQWTILESCQYGLLRGSNGNFMPNRKMTQYEILVTLMRSKVWYLDETTTPWYANYHAQAVELWVLDESETLASFGENLVTKEQLWKWTYRVLTQK